jgi:hypothetical protein
LALEPLRRSATFSIRILREDAESSMDAAVGFFCRANEILEFGDHCLVIAAVERFDAPAGHPLVLWRRTALRLHLDYPFLADSQALDSFILNWEAGVLPKAAWTHSAHVAATAYRAFDRSAGETFASMKQGIIHYNACVGTVDGPDSGYHETLTRFWSQVIAEFTHRGGYASRLDAARASVGEFGEDRDLHRMYYSFDVVRDRRARREWIPPDFSPDFG